ncbi:hypothetical protein LFT45_13265 [Arthrobacter sp. FW305-BF8]|uniref:hypothetical protein n=1 Tax=Arthrobacter sp. FW305-BF8 TaxID=2879617 RepID=UPI001F337489|nr:hypothetical protein [Arthrobacter sp. FW305-BF8]UKA52721.1 hypothetical protein LFT45_13265 [Arthrobacter sp. FW305-BF8]
MQSSYDIDPRLNAVLVPIVGPGRHDPDGTIELTVIVDGIIMSGSVVSEEAWSRRQESQISASGGYKAEVPGDAQETGNNPILEDQVRFIHFLEPVVISGGNPIRLNATRVDLRKVSAWSIGRLQYGEA